MSYPRKGDLLVLGVLFFLATAVFAGRGSAFAAEHEFTVTTANVSPEASEGETLTCTGSDTSGCEIQEIINLASAGDTINFMPGSGDETYEDVGHLLITKRLTLQRAPGAVGEVVFTEGLMIHIRAPGVVVQDLVFRNVTTPDSVVFIEGPAASLDVREADAHYGRPLEWHFNKKVTARDYVLKKELAADSGFSSGKTDEQLDEDIRDLIGRLGWTEPRRQVYVDNPRYFVTDGDGDIINFRTGATIEKVNDFYDLSVGMEEMTLKNPSPRVQVLSHILIEGNVFERPRDVDGNNRITGSDRTAAPVAECPTEDDELVSAVIRRNVFENTELTAVKASSTGKNDNNRVNSAYNVGWNNVREWNPSMACGIGKVEVTGNRFVNVGGRAAFVGTEGIVDPDDPDEYESATPVLEDGRRVYLTRANAVNLYFPKSYDISDNVVMASNPNANGIEGGTSGGDLIIRNNRISGLFYDSIFVSGWMYELDEGSKAEIVGNEVVNVLHGQRRWTDSYIDYNSQVTGNSFAGWGVTTTSHAMLLEPMLWHSYKGVRGLPLSLPGPPGDRVDDHPMLPWDNAGPARRVGRYDVITRGDGSVRSGIAIEDVKGEGEGTTVKVNDNVVGSEEGALEVGITFEDGGKIDEMTGNNIDYFNTYAVRNNGGELSVAGNYIGGAPRTGGTGRITGLDGLLDSRRAETDSGAGPRADAMTPPGAARPSATSIAVNGTALVVTYDKALDGESVPPKAAFRVFSTPSGVAEPFLKTIESVGVEGMAVTITLAEPVMARATVTLTYIVPETGPIQDAEGNSAVALTNEAVTNNTTAPAVAPVSGGGDGGCALAAFGANGGFDVGPLVPFMVAALWFLLGRRVEG